MLDELILGFLQLEHLNVGLRVDAAGVEQERMGRDSKQRLCEFSDAGEEECVPPLRCC